MCVLLAQPTQHGDGGPGRAHRHGEDGAGVLALVGQLHVGDGDGELGGRGALQLDAVISERWGRKRISIITNVRIYY